MVWNYHDDDLPAPDAPIALRIRNVPTERALVHHYRIDDHHSNSYSRWLGMGAPQQVSPDQYAELENAGNLELLGAPRWVDVENGVAVLDFALPRQGVSLLRLTWE